MRALLPLSVIGLFLISVAYSQENYSKIRIPITSREDLVRIHSVGVPLDHVGGRPGAWLDLFVSNAELNALRQQGISYTVLIDNWYAYYRDQLLQDQASALVPSTYPPVRNFHLGSMGGFLTLAEVVTELDSMRAKYPTLITARDSIGTTIQNRPIWEVKISTNADIDRQVPRAMYTGMHHAREPGSMMTLIYFMWYLLENYGTDKEVTDLLDHRELFFVPVVNPDGYYYNQTLSPGGGGMWRKNLRTNPDGSTGVDINRNYGFMWGYDNIGSSSRGGNEDYRGTGPFSEPEARAVRDLAIAKKFTVALNYHTYGDVLIYPWGYTDKETPDSAAYRLMAEEMTSVNRFIYGTGGPTLGYITNGDSDDWMYGDTLSKPRGLSMTPEVGDESDGFWAKPSRILPIAQENLSASLYLAHAAGEFIGLEHPVSVDDSAIDSLWINLRFVDKGRVDPPPLVDLSISSSDLTIVNGLRMGVQWQTGNPVRVLAFRKPGALVGDNVNVSVSIAYSGGSNTDSTSFRLGPSKLLYSDGAENTRNRWISKSNKSTGWDTTSLQARSGLRSFTDSPLGNYPDNVGCTFTLDSTFSLTGRAAELKFWARWQIETNYDFARVEISSDNGVTWIPLTGKYTSPASGIGAQVPQFSPGYHGMKLIWVEETIDLSQFLWKDPIRIRFRMASDQAVDYDGMYVDDIRLFQYSSSPSSGPRAAAWPSTITYGQIESGTRSNATGLFLQNVGGGSLVISSIHLSNPSYEIIGLPTLPSIISPGGVLQLNVIFHPFGPGTYRDSIVVTTNDSFTPRLAIVLQGSVFTVSRAQEGTLYAVTGSLDSGRVRAVDPFTGQTRIVGLSGFNEISSVRVNPKTFELIGLAPAGSSTQIVRINAQGGDAHVLSSVSLPNCKGLAFKGDTLYMGRLSGLYTVNINTGTASVLFAFPGKTINGLAIQPTTNELWGAIYTSATFADSLYRIDLSSRILKPVGPLEGPLITDILFDDTGKLFGVALTDTNSLVQIDPTTGATQTIGSMECESVKALAGVGVFADVNEQPIALLPKECRLEQNYPNPFNPTTGIRYQVSGTAEVELKVYDVLGREVATLVSEVQKPGVYTVLWDTNLASGQVGILASGVYFYRIKAGDFVATKKLLLLR